MEHVGRIEKIISMFTAPKSNIDTKNDGLENVSPFKHGNFGYLYVRFRGGIRSNLSKDCLCRTGMTQMMLDKKIMLGSFLETL